MDDTFALSIHDILADGLEAEIDQGVCCPNELLVGGAAAAVAAVAERCCFCGRAPRDDDPAPRHYMFGRHDRDAIRKHFFADGGRRRSLRGALAALARLACADCLDEHYEVDGGAMKSSAEEADWCLVLTDGAQRAYRPRDPNRIPQPIETIGDLKNERGVSQNPIAKKPLKPKSAKKSNRSPVKIVQCPICSKRMNKRGLKSHLQRHESTPTMAKIFSCSVCKLAFRDLENAQEHVNAADCSDRLGFKTTTNSVDLLPACSSSDQSKMIDVEEGDGSLIFTSDMFLDGGGGGGPGGATATLDPKIAVEVVEISQVYRCEFCDKVYCEKIALKNHMKIHNGLKNPFKCFCGKAFPTFSRYVFHKNFHKFTKVNGKIVEISDVSAEIENEKFPVVKLFLCEICEKSFFDRSYFVEHKKSAHPQKNQYKCKICDTTFSSRWSLGRHNKKNHGENKDTNSKADERQNQKIVSTEPSYNCDECGNAYLHSSDLRTHRNRTHKREANISCPKCSKMFYEACDMEKHFAIHLDQRPFSCGICSKAFRNKHAVNEHAQVHSNERPFSCDICGMSFKRARAVKNHRLIHAKKRQTKCQRCQRDFRSEARLKAHAQQCGKTKEEEIEIEVDTMSVLDPALNMNTLLIDTMPFSNDIANDDLTETTTTTNDQHLQNDDEFDSSSILFDPQQDVYYIKEENDITDGSYFISYESELFNQVSEGDYLIFNDDGIENDQIWNT